MPDWTSPASVNLVDLGFMDSRSKLIDLAAFLDRVQRAGQEEDFRVQALKNALTLLSQDKPQRAKDVLLSFSDPSTEPIAKAMAVYVEGDSCSVEILLGADFPAVCSGIPTTLTAPPGYLSYAWSNGGTSSTHMT